MDTGGTVGRLLALATQQAKEHAVVLLDPEGVVVGWVAGAEYLFGYSVDEMMGQKLDVLFTPEDRERGVPEHELEVARANGRAMDDRWQLRKDGTRFWASGAVVQLRNEDGTPAGFAKMLRDRTDLKAQLEAAERRADTLGATDRRKTLFLATVAHELRSPLQSLMHAVELLRMEPLLRRIEAGEIDTTRVISHRLTLDDAPEAYRMFRDKEDGCTKVVMRPGEWNGGAARASDTQLSHRIGGELH